jgi:hypothetical protein
VELRDTLQERVQKGAAWLDEYHPTWAGLIDLEILDLGDGCKCVLGQLFGPQYDLCDVVAGAIRWEDLAGFGFCLAADFDNTMVGMVSRGRAWQLLDELWYDEIEWRQS